MTSPCSAGDKIGIMNLKKGIYRHFKGNFYEVLEVARHSETEEWFVVYRALYGEKGIWIRPLDNFCQTLERDGKKLPRFTYDSAGEFLSA
jgi:hypothetical protein